MMMEAPGQSRQFVFVDEFNRHKRLKITRACEGCRKRKIRCDGALTGGPWPCSACKRLKLKCQPPAIDDQDDAPLDAPQAELPTPSSAASLPRSDPGNLWQTQMFAQPNPVRPDQGYTNGYFVPNEIPGHALPGAQVPNLVRATTETSDASTDDPQEVDASVRELSEHMGDLTIDIHSVAPYIANERKTLAETPAVEEADYILPASVTSDTTAKIPPEMMPSDDRVLDYFGYFFEYIHPYAPVLNRNQLYEQWRSARHSISPLILEGIFACVARYLEQDMEVKKWLALASRHEESFKDVPRISTIQGMILIMKARESISKRGYYYRSWMSVKYMTTMGSDLGLQDHYDYHRDSNTCTLNVADCLVRTRIHQLLFGLEILIGAPMGRTDFSIEAETVNIQVPQMTPDMDRFEFETSRRFTFLAQCFHNIKLSNKLWQSMRRLKKDWALDPSFVQRNEENAEWLRGLPSDLQLHFATDGSAPWLGSDHFTANVHIYHHLIIIMHHRPQLQTFLEMKDQRFREQLEICTNAASSMCRIQEALIRDFGVHGLQFFLRGVNFTIYCVLTCTMLHLAAITSPDPTQNSQARSFFKRHMRVLEHCLPSASPEMQAQINSLREAFSADTTKPFELKPTLGLRSPSVQSHPTPPSLRGSPTGSHVTISQASWTQGGASMKSLDPLNEYGQTFDGGIPTPPSVGGYPAGSFQSTPTSNYSGQQKLGRVTSAPVNGYDLQPTISNEPMPVWDPSGIFNSWNMAFGGDSIPQTAATAQVPDPRMQMPSAQGLAPHASPTDAQSMYRQNMGNVAANGMPEQAAVMPAVTPGMWQDVFTNAYVSGHGTKRYREASVDHTAYGQYSKRRG